MAAKKKATAKKALAKKKKPAGALTTYDYGDDAGAGFEGTTQADFAIPFLSILQTNSPQVEKNNDARIEGAEAGMLFNTVSQELYDGEDGVVFVPCARSHQYVEWRPRDSGGGFVQVHDPKSDMVTLSKAQATEFGKIKTDEGNDLIETFYYYGLLLKGLDGDEGEPEMVMVPFTSTKIKVYRQVMYRLRTLPGVPLFANRLLIQTVPQKNNKGSFYNFKIGPAGEDLRASLLPPDSPIIIAAKAFRDQVADGIARAAYESDANSGDETDEVF